MSTVLKDLKEQRARTLKLLQQLHKNYAVARASDNTWLALEILGDIEETENEVRGLEQRIQEHKRTLEAQEAAEEARAEFESWWHAQGEEGDEQ